MYYGSMTDYRNPYRHSQLLHQTMVLSENPPYRGDTEGFLDFTLNGLLVSNTVQVHIVHDGFLRRCV
jgi:hypothetical protein